MKVSRRLSFLKKNDRNSPESLIAMAEQGGRGEEASAIEAKTASGEDPKKRFSGGFVSDIFDTIDIPQAMMISAIKGEGLGKGLETRQSFGDFMPDTLGGKALGLVGDIALDPLNLLGVGLISKVGKAGKVAGAAGDAAKAGKFTLGERLMESASKASRGKKISGGDMIYGGVKEALKGSGRLVDDVAQKEGIVGEVAQGANKVKDVLGKKFSYLYKWDDAQKEALETMNREVAGGGERMKELLAPIAKLPVETKKKLLTRDANNNFVRKTADELAKDLSPEELDAVMPMFGAIDDASKELVDLGVLPKEIYDETVGRYINNAYMAKEIKNGKSIFQSSKGVKADTGILKKRQDLDPEVREALGEIDDVGFLSGKSLAKMTELIAKHKFFKKMADEGWAKDFAEDGYKKLPGGEGFFNVNDIEKVKLLAEAKELKPVRDKLSRLMKTRGIWVRKLESQINQLEKKGLDISLKSEKGKGLEALPSGPRVSTPDLNAPMGKGKVGVKAYHGTNAKFDVFDESRIGSNQGSALGDGIYFADNEGLARNYGKNIKEARLDIKNPFIVGKTDLSSKADGFIKKYDPEMVGDQNHLAYVKGKLGTKPGTGSTIEFIKSIAEKNNVKASQILRDMGFDGVKSGNEISVFSSKQILSQPTMGKGNDLTSIGVLSKLKPRDTKNFLKSLITDPNRDIAKLKKMVGTRDAKLTKILDEVEGLRGEYDEVVGNISSLRKDADSARMGGLAGKYVPDYMHDYIVAMSPAKGDLEKGLNKATAAFKYGKVVLNPATHARNIISNFLLNNFEGLSPARVDIYAEGFKQMKNGGKYADELKQFGYGADTFAAQELRGLLETSGKLGSAKGKITAGAKKVADAYQGEEKFAKMAQYIFQRKNGLDPEAAWKAAEDATFNYAQVTPFIRKLRENAFGFPFITFTYKATPQIAKTIIKKPTKISNLGKIGRSVESLSPANELAAERGAEPDFMKDSHMIKLPWKDKYGRSGYFDATYILPFGSIVSGDVNPIASSPAINLLKEIAANKDFTGKKIYKESGDTTAVGLAIATHIAKTYAPSVANIPLNLAESAQAEAGGMKNEQGGMRQTRTVGQELSRGLVGMKVQPFDLEYQKGRQNREKQEALKTFLDEEDLASKYESMYIPKGKEQEKKKRLSFLGK